MKWQHCGWVLGLTLSVSAQAEFTFTENFNGYVDGSKAGSNNSSPASSPVQWNVEAFTEIVTADRARQWLGLAQMSPISNPKISGNSIARMGAAESMLLFKYPAGIQSWSEQRFEINQTVLGKKGMEEMWLQYDVYIPSNYRLHDNNPSSGNYFGGGHKVLALFADDYGFPNSTLILGELFARKAPDGSVAYDGNGYNDSTLSTYLNGDRIYTYFTTGDDRVAKWMDASTDLGTWQRRTLHFKFPTGASSNNGICEVWVKRANGSIMKVIDENAGKFYGYSQNYFNGGYLNGWNNDGFEEATHMLVDNVILSDNAQALDLQAIPNDLWADTELGRRLFVLQQFRDLLEREGSSQAVQYWTNQMNHGLSRTDLIVSFLNSGPASTQIKPLGRLMLAYYGRLFVNDSLNAWHYWNQQLSTGQQNLDQISAAFARSAAFSKLYGSLSDAQFVQQLYQNALGRAASAEEISSALTQITASSRAQWVRQWVETSAVQTATRAKLGEQWLFAGMGRKVPSATGEQYWLGKMASDFSAAQTEMVKGYLGLLLPNYAGAASAYRARFSAP